MKCPKCNCPFFNVSSYRTADMSQAWKDTDGTWYSGPYADNNKYTCQGCGYSYEKNYRRGKLIKEPNE